MSSDLMPCYVDLDQAEMRNCQPGWWLMDDNGRFVDGPYSSRDEAKKHAEEDD